MKKIVLLLMMVFCMLLFTACKGATVTSTTKFHSDGSGIRTVSAVIRSEDAKKMKLSFEDLDKLLESVSPESVNLARTMNANNDATYEFSFSFNDIEDYNKKVSEITGENHNATWFTDSTVFNSDIAFKEKQCTYDLIKWAFKAFEKSGYSKFYDNLNLYDIGKNQIFYGDTLVYSESGEGDNPEFTINNAQIVNKVSVFTDYDLENNLSKKLILEFDKKNFANLNTDLAKKLLDTYSNQFAIDLANATITLELKGEDEIRAFLQNSDSAYHKDKLKYQIKEPSPFSFFFQFKEEYNLSKFFSDFKFSTEYVNNYLELPEDLNYENRVFYAPNTSDEERKGYSLSGKYKLEEDYKTNYALDNKVTVSNVKVLYEMQDGYVGQIGTEFLILPNGCNVDEAKLRDYYKNKVNFVNIEKKKDNYHVSLTNKYQFKSKEFKTSSLANFLVKSNTLLKKEEEFLSNYKLSLFIPVSNNTKVQYQIKISNSIDLKSISFDSRKMSLDKKLDTTSLQNYKDKNGYSIIFKDKSPDNTITMRFVERKHTLLFIFVSIIILLLCAFIILTMRDIRKNEDTSIIDNWKVRFIKIKNKFNDKSDKV